MAKPGGMARILNAKHFERLSGYLEDNRVAASVVHGGYMDPKKL
jgi:aldehyde dehydrogenase (NAD+)